MPNFYRSSDEKVIAGVCKPNTNYAGGKGVMALDGINGER